DVGARDRGRAEELGAPADLLDARERQESREAVGRILVRRGAALVVRERVPPAEGTARVDPGRAGAVEGREQPGDEVGGGERGCSGIAVRRQYPIDQGRERRELAVVEEPRGARVAVAAPGRARQHARRDGRSERRQELAPPQEEPAGASALDGGSRRRGGGR